MTRSTVTVTPAPGTAKGKITTTRLVPGAQVLVTPGSRKGSVAVAVRKTGATVATVESVRSIGNRRIEIITDQGVARASASQTWFIATPKESTMARKSTPAASPAGKPTVTVTAIETPNATRATWKAHGNPTSVLFFGRADGAPDSTGTPATIAVDKGMVQVNDSAGKHVDRFGVASKFWAAPVGEEATPATPAKATKAAKATPVKAAAPIPTSVKEMTRDQKRAVATVLIRVAGGLASNWADQAEALMSDEELTALEGVTAKVAGELIGTWLSYCPGTEWSESFGPRPRGASK